MSLKLMIDDGVKDREKFGNTASAKLGLSAQKVYPIADGFKIQIV